MKCDYEKRIDHHRNAVKAQKYHTCFWIPDKREYIRNYTQEATEIEPGVVSPITLFDELCILVGRLNLSLEAACSDTMYYFIRKCVSFGMILSQSYKDPEERFQYEFPQPKRDKFRQRFISLSYEINRKRMKQFTHTYASISLDEGSTLKTPYLDYVLHNTKKKLGEYVADTREMTGGKAEDYIETIPKGLLYIEKYNINVSTVVVDGNTAQLKAFKKSFPKSLRYSENPMIKHLIVVPCLCHRINNAYKFAIQHDSRFNSLIDRMREIASFLSESDSSFNKCPKFIDTRWIYDFDILRYLKKNLEGINTFLEKHEKALITEDILDLENMLMILKKLILIFEDPNQSLSTSYKIIESALDAFEEAESISQNSDFYRQVRNSLKAYTINSKEGGLLLLSYVLTPEGLKDINDRKNGSKRKKGSLKDFQFHQNKIQQDTEDSNLDFVKETIIKEFYEPESSNAEPTSTVSSIDADSYYQRCSLTMSKICETLELSQEQQENVMKAQDAYLLSELPKICEHFCETLDKKSWNWEIIYEDERFKDFADIALRLE